LRHAGAGRLARHGYADRDRDEKPARCRAKRLPKFGRSLLGYLPKIKTPTTVIAGSSDAICFPAANSYLAKNIPGSQSDAIFIETGHAPFLTRPGEFDAALRSALR
jgi:pimeloyl-ACP methyl ester carboxylesterase